MLRHNKQKHINTETTPTPTTTPSTTYALHVAQPFVKHLDRDRFAVIECGKDLLHVLAPAQISDERFELVKVEHAVAVVVHRLHTRPRQSHRHHSCSLPLSPCVTLNFFLMSLSFNWMPKSFINRLISLNVNLPSHVQMNGKTTANSLFFSWNK